jgi:hypothetical protein
MVRKGTLFFGESALFITSQPQILPKIGLQNYTFSRQNHIFAKKNSAISAILRNFGFFVVELFYRATRSRKSERIGLKSRCNNRRSSVMISADPEISWLKLSLVP